MNIEKEKMAKPVGVIGRVCIALTVFSFFALMVVFKHYGLNWITSLFD
jgi:hypothetical protein